MTDEPRGPGRPRVDNPKKFKSVSVSEDVYKNLKSTCQRLGVMMKPFVEQCIADGIKTCENISAEHLQDGEGEEF